MASPSVLRRSSRHQNHELLYEDTENVKTSTEHVENDLSKLEEIYANNEETKSNSKSPSKRPKVSPKTNGRRYPSRSSLDSERVLRSKTESTSETEPVNNTPPVNTVIEESSLHSRRALRTKTDSIAETEPVINTPPVNTVIEESSLDSGRVLRSKTKSTSETEPVINTPPANTGIEEASLDSGRVLRSKTKSTSETEPVNDIPPVNPVIKELKKGRRNCASNDDYPAIRNRVRYLLTRMKYEQTLINAYSGEGWKGQSAEKIRPQKELDRAKSEILKCKLKLRELFRRLDSLLSEGKFDDSLFDSEGQIDSEDIYCARCSSKDLSTDNDIILCDGMCIRAFHQKCLNPPLLSEDIPKGDEGWLCPACECKIDCVKLLNEFQGSAITLMDMWEKVFPEAVEISNGGKQDNGLPSADAENCDYNPDNSKADPDNKKIKILGNSSDDLEDDDFDLDSKNIDKSSDKEEPNADGSDFTSDSDELCNELNKTSDVIENSASSLTNLETIAKFGEEILAELDRDLNEENAQVLGKRKSERLDYKKLHDETYGKSSSESSDDENWSETAGTSEDEDWHAPAGMRTPKKRKKDACRNNYNRTSNGNTHIIENQGYQRPDSNGNISSASVSRRIGELAKQKLHESFQENQYPTREKKESLAQELGISYDQVHRWFNSSRHSLRACSSGLPGLPTINKVYDFVTTESTSVADQPNKKGRKEKTLPEIPLKEGSNMNQIDRDRQKAIARELRKMKQGR